MSMTDFLKIEVIRKISSTRLYYNKQIVSIVIFMCLYQYLYLLKTHYKLIV
jgi:hypothetical protein